MHNLNFSINLGDISLRRQDDGTWSFTITRLNQNGNSQTNFDNITTSQMEKIFEAFNMIQKARHDK